jgi:hypothetical protein
MIVEFRLDAAHMTIYLRTRYFVSLEALQHLRYRVIVEDLSN